MKRWMMLAACAVVMGCESAPPVADNAALTQNMAEPVANDAELVVANEAIEPAVRPLLNIAPGAVALVDPNSGRSRELAFGTPREAAIEAVTLALGAPGERGINNECGGGAMRYATFADALTLWFQEDKLVGWHLDDAGPGLTTATGAGIGSTRSAVAGALAIEDVRDSSLGREFTTAGGTLSGLLDGSGDAATVTALWSGQACLFR